MLGKWVLFGGMMLAVGMIQEIGGNTAPPSLYSCIDWECEEWISQGRTMLRYIGKTDKHLSFGKNQHIHIISKPVDKHGPDWVAKIGNKVGLVPKDMIREDKVNKSPTKFKLALQEVLEVVGLASAGKEEGDEEDAQEKEQGELESNEVDGIEIEDIELDGTNSSGEVTSSTPKQEEEKKEVPVPPAPVEEAVQASEPAPPTHTEATDLPQTPEALHETEKSEKVPLEASIDLEATASTSPTEPLAVLEASQPPTTTESAFLQQDSGSDSIPVPDQNVSLEGSGGSSVSGVTEEEEIEAVYNVNQSYHDDQQQKLEQGYLEPLSFSGSDAVHADTGSGAGVNLQPSTDTVLQGSSTVLDDYYLTETPKTEVPEEQKVSVSPEDQITPRIPETVLTSVISQSEGASLAASDVPVGAEQEIQATKVQNLGESASNSTPKEEETQFTQPKEEMTRDPIIEGSEVGAGVGPAVEETGEQGESNKSVEEVEVVSPGKVETLQPHKLANDVEGEVEKEKEAVAEEPETPQSAQEEEEDIELTTPAPPQDEGPQETSFLEDFGLVGNQLLSGWFSDNSTAAAEVPAEQEQKIEMASEPGPPEKSVQPVTEPPTQEDDEEDKESLSATFAAVSQELGQSAGSKEEVAPEKADDNLLEQVTVSFSSESVTISSSSDDATASSSSGDPVILEKSPEEKPTLTEAEQKQIEEIKQQLLNPAVVPPPEKQEPTEEVAQEQIPTPEPALEAVEVTPELESPQQEEVETTTATTSSNAFIVDDAQFTPESDKSIEPPPEPVEAPAVEVVNASVEQALEVDIPSTTESPPPQQEEPLQDPIHASSPPVENQSVSDSVAQDAQLPPALESGVTVSELPGPLSLDSSIPVSTEKPPIDIASITPPPPQVVPVPSIFPISEIAKEHVPEPEVIQSPPAAEQKEEPVTETHSQVPAAEEPVLTSSQEEAGHSHDDHHDHGHHHHHHHHHRNPKFSKAWNDSSTSSSSIILVIKHLSSTLLSFLPEALQDTILDVDDALVFTGIIALTLVSICVPYFLIEGYMSVRPLKKKVVELNKSLWKVSAAYETQQEEFEIFKRKAMAHDEFRKRAEQSENDVVILKELEKKQREQITKLKAQLKLHMKEAVDIRALIEKTLKDKKVVEDEVVNFKRAADKAQEQLTRAREELATFQKQSKSTSLQLQNSSKNTEVLSSKIGLLEKEVENLKGQLALESEKRKGAVEEMVKAREEKGKVEGELDTMKKICGQYEQTVEGLTQEICKLESELCTIKETLGEDSPLLEIAEVQAKAEFSEKEANSLRTRLEGICADNETLREKLKEVGGQLEEVRGEKEATRKRLEVLEGYFKEREEELLRSLESLQQKESVRDKGKDELIELIEDKEETVKKLEETLEGLKDELEERKVQHRNEIRALEAKGHENWLSLCQAERKAQDARKEAELLRQKLTKMMKEREVEDEDDEEDDSGGDGLSGHGLLYPGVIPHELVPPPILDLEDELGLGNEVQPSYFGLGDFVPPPPLEDDEEDGEGMGPSKRPPPLGGGRLSPSLSDYTDEDEEDDEDLDNNNVRGSVTSGSTGMRRREEEGCTDGSSGSGSGSPPLRAGGWVAMQQHHQATLRGGGGGGALRTLPSSTSSRATASPNQTGVNL